MDLENKCPKHYENFEKTFANVLEAHAPRKTKVLPGILKPHVGKNLREAIMKRSKFKLKNKANRTKQIELNFKMILLNIKNNEIW